MYTQKKRKFSITLSLLLILSMLFGGISVFANEIIPKDNKLKELQLELLQNCSNQEEIETVNKYIEIYKNDPMFSKHYEETPNEAISMVKNMINYRVSQLSVVSTRGNSGDDFFLCNKCTGSKTEL